VPARNQISIAVMLCSVGILRPIIGRLHQTPRSACRKSCENPNKDVPARNQSRIAVSVLLRRNLKTHHARLHQMPEEVLAGNHARIKTKTCQQEIKQEVLSVFFSVESYDRSSSVCIKAQELACKKSSKNTYIQMCIYVHEI
jgi:hypothetical protein